jgi:hypothetical protein
MVPSHMADEYVDGKVPEGPSNYPQIERARRFCRNLRLIAIPSTLLRITQKDEQLKLMSLKNMGAPISWATLLTKLGFENYGDVKGSTEHEKWVNEQFEDLKLKAAAAQMAAELGLGGDEGPGQGNGGGRPPSGQKPMKPSQKGGAGGKARVVNKES